MLRKLLSRKKKEKKHPDWPNEEERKSFEQALDDLRYAKVGAFAVIAERVGCTRQYVHQVLASVPPFKQSGYKARAIWETLPVVLAEEGFLRAMPIIKAVECGDTARVTTNDRHLPVLIGRKLRELGVTFKMTEEVAVGEMVRASIYTFEPNE